MQASRFSLSRQHRLHYPWEYKRFFDRAEVFRLRECVVFRIPNDSGHFRLGITLKARGTSVQRNRVKRRIREALRTQAPALGSHDYNVVVPTGKRLDHVFAEKLWACLKTELPRALAKGGHRNGGSRA